MPSDTNVPTTAPAEVEQAPKAQISIKKSPKAQGGALPDTTNLDLGTAAARDRVREAVVTALARGKITPAAARAFTSVLASAAEDRARELELHLERAIQTIEQLRARLDRR